MTTRHRAARVLLTATALTTLTSASLSIPAHAAPAGSPVPSVFNVRGYGATGNGRTIDTPAINKAIAAANAAGGGVVEFPAGTYASVSVHLLSQVTLRLDVGATLRAATGGFDAAEANAYSQYQDFGHSHFHDALLWGENLHNVGFTGAGTIDGASNLKTGNIAAGQADKAVSIKVCDGLTFSGITIKEGGHFGVLMNGCDHVAVDHVTISTHRDGINVINTSDVTVTNSTIASVDDSLVFKSDFALGRTYPSAHINVTDTTVSSSGNNALQFGSETCGDFSDAHFSRITVLAGGKAGIGVESMDGAHISGVSYNDITMTHATTPIFLKIGSRGRCPGHPGAGTIDGVSFTNVTGTALKQNNAEYTSSIAGLPGHPITNISFTDVNLTVPGGHPASDATIVPPEQTTDYTPKAFGTRPSYGWWLRHVSGISFHQSAVRFDANDGRPAFQTTDGKQVSVDASMQRGTGSPYDLGFDTVTGYSTTGSTVTGGGAPRVHAVNSTPEPAPRAAAATTDWSRAVVDSTMRRFPDPTKLGGWGYQVGLFLYGTDLVYQRTHNSAYLTYIQGWVDHFVSASGGIGNSFDSLDSMEAGNLLVLLNQQTGQAKYATAARTIRNRLNTYPRTSDGGFWHATGKPGQLWLDGTYMVLPFLLRYGAAYNDAAYADSEAAKQLNIYAGHLAHPSGLLFHAYDQNPISWADPKTHHSSQFWCRAVGWYGMASMSTLDALPANAAGRPGVLRTLQNLVAAMAHYQDPATGRWFQVVDKGSLSGNWTETSCSAMYTFVIAKSVQLGYVPTAYRAVADRGYQGVLAEVSLDSSGLAQIRNICVGTNVGDLAYYLGRTRATNDFHGLGSFLIMNEWMEGNHAS